MNKHSCRWFETPWPSFHMNAMIKIYQYPQSCAYAFRHKPLLEPMLHPDPCRHMATPGHNELVASPPFGAIPLLKPMFNISCPFWNTLWWHLKWNTMIFSWRNAIENYVAKCLHFCLGPSVWTAVSFYHVAFGPIYCTILWIFDNTQASMEHKYHKVARLTVVNNPTDIYKCYIFWLAVASLVHKCLDDI